MEHSVSSGTTLNSLLTGEAANSWTNKSVCRYCQPISAYHRFVRISVYVSLPHFTKVQGSEVLKSSGFAIRWGWLTHSEIKADHNVTIIGSGYSREMHKELILQVFSWVTDDFSCELTRFLCTLMVKQLVWPSRETSGISGRKSRERGVFAISLKSWKLTRDLK